MYCIKCGAELAESESVCPLCKTRVYHPDIEIETREGLYPKGKYPEKNKRYFLPQIMLTLASVIALATVILCDLQFAGTVTWSGIVVGALILGYVCAVLPMWFRHPNPVIFVPCDFVVAGLYLAYINMLTNGDWFLAFAFPIVGAVGIIVVTVVTLMWYVRRGACFIFGGAITALGLFMLPLEFLTNLTFGITGFFGWSLYPLITLVLVGGFLIFLGICRPARESMQRRFFI